MALKNGTLVYSQPGALPAPALEQLIAAVGELDVAQVGAVARQRLTAMLSALAEEN